jgi:hypothetical protein
MGSRGEEVGVTGPAITFDTGALVALERRKERFEPASDEVVKLAGVALGKVRGATTIDAIVAAFAVQRTGIVYTGDFADFSALRAFFPALRVFAI